ncbi:hypothetical protein IF2G_05277 [Cordyceps javanica]|nr:hypothetical protein IF2G_05277 [Cordyceps javanica]
MMMKGPGEWVSRQIRTGRRRSCWWTKQASDVACLSVRPVVCGYLHLRVP